MKGSAQTKRSIVEHLQIVALKGVSSRSHEEFCIDALDLWWRREARERFGEAGEEVGGRLGA